MTREINHSPYQEIIELNPKKDYSSLHPKPDQINLQETLVPSTIKPQNDNPLQNQKNLVNVTLLFLRFCIEVGILTLPFYIKVYGGLLGTLVFVLVAYVNHLMYSFLLDVSEATNTFDYMSLSKLLCPPWVSRVFRVTLLFDLTSVIFSVMIILYNILEAFASSADLFPLDWYKSERSLKTYHPKVVFFRLSFNLVTFFLFLFFMFSPNLGKLRKVSNNYLLILLSLCVYLLVEMGFFRSHLKESKDFEVNYVISEPSGEWVGSFFGVMLAFYAQQYFFSVRKELRNPTILRVKRTVSLSMVVLTVFFLVLGE